MQDSSLRRTCKPAPHWGSGTQVLRTSNPALHGRGTRGAPTPQPHPVPTTRPHPRGCIWPLKPSFHGDLQVLQLHLAKPGFA